MKTLTDQELARVAEIQRSLDAHDEAHGRYWGGGAYQVRSDAKGGCDEDIATMHAWETRAPIDMAFLLDLVQPAHDEAGKEPGT